MRFFTDENNHKLLKALAELGINPHNNQQASSNRLQGQVFVFTGALEHFSRQEGQALVEAQGGRASGSVSKKTDYVIVGPGAGSKLAKAEQLGITILSETDFLELIKQEN